METKHRKRRPETTGEKNRKNSRKEQRQPARIVETKQREGGTETTGEKNKGNQRE